MNVKTEKIDGNDIQTKLHNFLIYKGGNGKVNINVMLINEDLWLTQSLISELFSSERRFYQKITDIYESCSIDYDKDSEITKTFFKTVQNKLHYAITGYTTTEIIYNRVDSNKEHMGLTNWKNSPDKYINMMLILLKII